ncbi:MAG TPA: DNA methyltransferase, partial [Aggregatilineales bacterium]|nr:DNA methyltransferase [Aggregatilineales bacterium]
MEKINSFELDLSNSKIIPQSLLNIDQKIRTNPFSWNGQFSPQFVETLLAHYAESGMTLLDPFVGSGTTLLEAGRMSLKAIGVDINPSAYHLAKNYIFMNYPIPQRKIYLQRATNLLDESFGIPLL